jgi:hypothetical protein
MKTKQPRVPMVGDKVIPPGAPLVYTIARVSKDRSEVDLNYDDSLLNRFRVPVRNLKWVDEK